jgi:hypothetical protein
MCICICIELGYESLSVAELAARTVCIHVYMYVLKIYVCM